VAQLVKTDYYSCKNPIDMITFTLNLIFLFLQHTAIITGVADNLSRIFFQIITYYPLLSYDYLSHYRECAVGNCPTLLNNSSKASSKLDAKPLYCSNTSMQRKVYPKTEVFKTGLCGHGLKVAVDVPSNTILIEYTGG
jgi:hypothetical protein